MDTGGSGADLFIYFGNPSIFIVHELLLAFLHENSGGGGRREGKCSFNDM
jgi:hypothetical protein